MSEPTYRVVRHFRDHPMNTYTLDRGLSLEEAREHCRDPESSSRTCRARELLELTDRMGPWFDGYEHE